MQLPFRKVKYSNKGTYGHLAVISGQKIGASTLSAKAALRFGSGLVSLVGAKDLKRPHTLMHSYDIPENATAIALGMGLGNALSVKELNHLLENDLPLVADADIFHMSILNKILTRKNVVLTPHPKEFVMLLKHVKLADITVAELQEQRFKYAQLFCEKFPSIVLVLKGANVIIGLYDEFYINPHGTPALAKGGSGDVLSGLIGALLTQSYKPLDAAINASLAHAKLALNYKGADFSLTPDDLIEGIGYL